MPKRPKTKEAKASSVEKETIFLHADTLPPIYSNFVQVVVTDNEVRLIFAEILESTPARQILKQTGRHYLSHRLAKTLLQVLKGGLDHFESRTGQTIPGSPQPVKVEVSQGILRD